MSEKVLNKVNNDIFSYDTEGGVFKMSRVMPAEIHHVTAGAGTSGYMLTSTGNGWTWTDPSTLDSGVSLTSGTGVSITNDIISIGQSVGTTDNVTFNSLDANVSKTSNLSISSTTRVEVSATEYMGLVSQSNFDIVSNSGSMGIYVQSGDIDIYAQNINFRDGAGTVLANKTSFTNWDTAYSWGDHSVVGYLNNVSISAPVPNQFLTYNGTNWINVNPDTDDISEGPGNLYYTDERVDSRIALASLGDLNNVNVTTPDTGEILSYNGTDWVRDGTIKSLTGTLDGTSYDYINVTAPQHVKASWSYSTSLSITAPHASMRLDGGLFISSKAPVTDSSGNKQVLGAIEGTPTDLEVDFMVEGTSMLIGDTFIGPNGNLVLFGDILSNSGQTILGSDGIVFDSNLSVWNEDTPKTYSSGLEGEVLVSQGPNKPPKWEPMTGGGGGGNPVYAYVYLNSGWKTLTTSDFTDEYNLYWTVDYNNVNGMSQTPPWTAVSVPDGIISSLTNNTDVTFTIPQGESGVYHVDVYAYFQHTGYGAPNLYNVDMQLYSSTRGPLVRGFLQNYLRSDNETGLSNYSPTVSFTNLFTAGEVLSVRVAIGANRNRVHQFAMSLYKIPTTGGGGGDGGGGGGGSSSVAAKISNGLGFGRVVTPASNAVYNLTTGTVYTFGALDPTNQYANGEIEFETQSGLVISKANNNFGDPQYSHFKIQTAGQYIFHGQIVLQIGIDVIILYIYRIRNGQTEMMAYNAQDIATTDSLYAPSITTLLDLDVNDEIFLSFVLYAGSGTRMISWYGRSVHNYFDMYKV